MKRYETFELTFFGPKPESSAAQADVRTEFTCGEETWKVKGFYDGEGTYKVRFLPQRNLYLACFRYSAGDRKRRMYGFGRNSWDGSGGRNTFCLSGWNKISSFRNYGVRTHAPAREIDKTDTGYIEPRTLQQDPALCFPEALWL